MVLHQNHPTLVSLCDTVGLTHPHPSPPPPHHHHHHPHHHHHYRHSVIMIYIYIIAIIITIIIIIKVIVPWPVKISDNFSLTQEFIQGCLRLRGQAKAIDMATLIYMTKRMARGSDVPNESNWELQKRPKWLQASSISSDDQWINGWNFGMEEWTWNMGVKDRNCCLVSSKNGDTPRH